MIEEKKDIHKVAKRFESSLKRLKLNEHITKEDAKKINQFVEDCIIGKNSRKKVGKYRLLRYFDSLSFILNYLKKSFSGLTEKDVTNFYLALENNRIKPNNKKCYSDNTKTEFIKTLKKYGKWYYKNNKSKYEKLFGWLKDFKVNTEIPALTKEEIDKIASSCDIRDKALIMFLFDSGARAEELLNIKLEDLRKEDKYYKVRIRVSKTKPRTIILPLASNTLEIWLNVHPEKSNPGAYLFPLTYDNLRMILTRKSGIINKRLYPHLFRHSSATFYANKYGNPYKLCYRYGWAMNSKEVQRYIDREGIVEEEIKGIIEQDTLENLKKENDKMKVEMALLKDEHNKLFNVIKKLDHFVEQHQ